MTDDHKGSSDHRHQFLTEKAKVALRDGSELAAWWRQAAASGTVKPFSLIPDSSSAKEMLGFYSSLNFRGQPTSVMGCLQKVRFRRCGSPASGHSTLESFVKSQFLNRCRWTHPDSLPGGFGYRPLVYKLNGSDTYGAFPRSDSDGSVDLAEIGRRYEWVVLQVDIHDFVRSFPPLKRFVRTASRFIKEAAYVVVHQDYFHSLTAPPDNVAAESCFGYSFLPCEVEPNFFGFGPGRFDTAIKQFRFYLLDTGDLEIQLSFIVTPRSQKVLNLWGFDPVYSSAHLADALTFNLFRVKQRAHDKLDAIMLELHGRVHQNLLEGMREIWERQLWTAPTAPGKPG